MAVTLSRRVGGNATAKPRSRGNSGSAGEGSIWTSVASLPKSSRSCLVPAHASVYRGSITDNPHAEQRGARCPVSVWSGVVMEPIFRLVEPPFQVHREQAEAERQRPADERDQAERDRGQFPEEHRASLEGGQIPCQLARWTCGLATPTTPPRRSPSHPRPPRRYVELRNPQTRSHVTQPCVMAIILRTHALQPRDRVSGVWLSVIEIVRFRTIRHRTTMRVGGGSQPGSGYGCCQGMWLSGDSLSGGEGCGCG